ncbi:hypothetical protein HDU84_001133 [Entophlyctis sp. JEL0112]|nr:hypothetical protein HDU84_001133 [Entophlyctis sp. JEL0112]
MTTLAARADTETPAPRTSSLSNSGVQSPHHFRSTSSNFNSNILQYESIPLLGATDSGSWVQRWSAKFNELASTFWAAARGNTTENAIRPIRNSNNVGSLRVNVARTRSRRTLSFQVYIWASLAVVFLIVILGVLSGGRADKPKTPIDLPDLASRLSLHFVPTRYRLSLTVDPESESDIFVGSSAIELKPITKSAVSNITLHSAGLNFTNANVSLYGVVTIPIGPSEFNSEAFLDQSSISSVHHSIHRTSKVHTSSFEPLHPVQIIWNPTFETVTLVFDREIVQPDPSMALTLVITYTGSLGYRTMRGFYRSPVTPALDGAHPPKKQRFVAATHFEPLFARRAFPCFDEPHLKAKFSVVVAVPSGFTVVSNKQVEEVVEMPNVKGWYVWRFGDGIIPMPTYLVAWAVGKMTFVETKTQMGARQGTVVRGYVYDGMNEDYIRFAVGVALNSVKFFENMFGVPFPIEKLDLWPMPDFSAQGMENLGLCIFQDSGIFIKASRQSNRSEENERSKVIKDLTVESDPSAQIYVSNLVSHEVSHQWLGDYVTMTWWNSLWLNEGFAEWAQYYGTNISYPEWKIFDKFFELEHMPVFEKELGGYARSVGVRDESSVNRTADIIRMFDDTTYSKGASVIRMFQFWMKNIEPDPQFIGGDNNTDDKFECSTWCRVVRNYLANNAFASVSPSNFYDSVDTEDSSGLISAAMQGWIEKPGVPVVWIDQDSAVRQERLTGWRNSTLIPASKPRKPDPDDKGWFLPFAYKFVEVNVTSPALSEKVFWQFLDSRSETHIKVRSDAQKLLIANPGRTGLFCFKPSTQDLTLYAAVMSQDHSILSPIDRAGLVFDMVTLLLSNYVLPNQSLPVLSYLKNERNPSVWSVAVQQLSRLLRVMEYHNGYPDVISFVQKLVFPAADYVGWWPSCDKENHAANSFTMRELRSIILPFAAYLKHDKTVNASLKLFDKWVESANVPNVTNPCFQINEDKGIMIRIVYETAMRVAPLPTAVHLRNLSLALPGAMDSDRLFPLSVSEFPFHLKILVEQPGHLLNKLEVLKAVAKNGGQIGVEMSWEALRWGRVPSDDETTSQFQSGWEDLLASGGPSVDDLVEYVVSSGFKGGAVWRDAVAATGSSGGGFGVYPQNESPVLTAVRRGLERAEAAAQFRDVLGDLVKNAI